MPHLDFCNSVLFGLRQKSIKKLQTVQNIAAKLVLKRTKSESQNVLSMTYNCCRNQNLIIIVIVYKCLQGNVSKYLQSLLTRRPVFTEWLRTSTLSNDLHVPVTSSHTFASSSIGVSGPSLWNELSCNIKDWSNLKLFRKKSRHIILTSINNRLPVTAHLKQICKGPWGLVWTWH